MTLGELAWFSTAISGFAVTASVIYLAIQTHQNTRNIRAMIHQGSTARTASILTDLMDPEYCAAWIEGNGGEATPEAVRARQFFFHCSVALNSMEDLYVQHRAKLLNEEQFVRGSETYRCILTEPGMRKYWEDERPLFAPTAPGFTAYVDGLLSVRPESKRHHHSARSHPPTSSK
jgi:hypothetical protein